MLWTKRRYILMTGLFTITEVDGGINIMSANTMRDVKELRGTCDENAIDG